MKRMKALLSVVIVLAMVIALSVTALAAGTIKVAEPGKHVYQIWKVFDADSSSGEYVYTTDNDELKKLITDGDSANSIDPFTDLVLTGSSGAWTVTKTSTYSAEEFAAWLADALDKLGNNFPLSAETSGNTTASFTDANSITVEIPGTDSLANVSFTSDDVTTGVDVADDGYYFITYKNGEPYALTTVDQNVNGGKVQVQNKKDMPFDKDVFNDDNEDIHDQSVQAGDTLTYIISGKVPNVEDNTQYSYVVWDKLGKGLKLVDDSIEVYVVNAPVDDPSGLAGETPITLTEMNESLANPITATSKDGRWQNTSGSYDDNRPTFVVNLNVADDTKYTEGQYIYIVYDVTVDTDLGVLVNTGHLVSNDYVKDAQTQNYTSEITVDKYATGNATQKLAGATFKLARVNTATETAVQIARSADDTYDLEGLDATTYTVEWYNIDAGVVSWKPDKADGTAKTTLEDGAVSFTGLPDGTYYLEEIEAPTGYVKLETPVEVIVNGKASLDPNNVVEDNLAKTEENQNHQLEQIAQVANTPGSVLPSTGGRGTTMLYMAGLAMMLAAGAFLIFRRRAEAGK